MKSKGELEPDEDVLETRWCSRRVQVPARIKCALLGWMAWKDATAQAIAHSDTHSETNGGQA